MSYDAHQREAYQVRCVRCARWWYQTRLIRFVCTACRQDAQRRRQRLVETLQRQMTDAMTRLRWERTDV